jgi:DNA (cytosine-5)-methyltransferase 1
LSSNGGRDFGTFLGALGELGYGFAYRVLDAQYFGVAQRRRRVFVVGYLGDWRVAAAVLFERESLQGNIKPGRKKREEVTADAEGSVGTTVFAGNQQSEIAATLQTTCDDYSRADGFNVIIDRAAFNQGENAQYEPRIEAGETMSSLVARGPHAVAQPIAVLHSMAIRRLTPKECERLQGFPDDWTKIPYRNKPADQCPDGPRYKACGNSMAVPVMRWIGQRIQYVENLMKEL